MNSMFDQSCDVRRLHLWKTETDEYILKYKDKVMPSRAFGANGIFTVGFVIIASKFP